MNECVLTYRSADSWVISVIDSLGRCFALIHCCRVTSFGNFLPGRQGRCGSGSSRWALPSKIRSWVSSVPAGGAGVEAIATPILTVGPRCVCSKRTYIQSETGVNKCSNHFSDFASTNLPRALGQGALLPRQTVSMSWTAQSSAYLGFPC